MVILSTFLVFNYNCTSTIDLLQNIQRLKFKLGSVDNFKIAGISVTNKSAISDFSIADGLKLVNAFSSGKLPASFRLNVLAKNPNDGTGGSPRTTTTLTKLKWRLLIDSKETIDGNISQNIEVPGTGQETTIPIDMSLDLYKFFNELGYEGGVNLALALGGVSGSSSRITLKATPSMQTIFGPISSGEITIVDKQFN
jgi:hypothetical protein